MISLLLNLKDVFNLLHLDKYFSNFNVHRNIIKMQILTQEFWVRPEILKSEQLPGDANDTYLQTTFQQPLSAVRATPFGTFVFLAHSTPTLNFNFWEILCKISYSSLPIPHQEHSCCLGPLFLSICILFFENFICSYCFNYHANSLSGMHIRLVSGVRSRF